MKSNYCYILLMACAMLFIGCQKDENVLTAELEGYRDAKSKVYVNDEGYACWNYFDYVQINGQSDFIYYNGPNNFVFRGIDNVAACSEYTALYPGWYVKEGKSFGLLQAQFYMENRTPDLDNYVTVQEIEAPMVAYTNSGHHLKFYNTGSVMKFIVPNNLGCEADLIKIDLIADEGVNLWGTITYTQEDNAVPVVSAPRNDTPANNKNVLSLLLHPEHITKHMLHGETFSCYMAVPCVTTSFAVEVTYRISPNKYQVYTTKRTSRNTIERSTMGTMDLTKTPLTFVEEWSLEGDGSETNPYKIRTEADFVELTKLSKFENFTGKYIEQCNDISLIGLYPRDLLWIGPYRLVGNAGFQGTYDGKGYTIQNGYRWDKATSGIFTRVAGNAYIKNLVVDTYIDGLSDEQVGGPVGQFVPAVNECIGGLINFVDGGDSVTINNCKVIGTINGYYDVGGLVGSVRYCNNCNISNCINTAYVSGSIAGGLIGNLTSVDAIKIVNCVNKGLIRLRHKMICGGGFWGESGYASARYIDIQNSYSQVSYMDEIFGGIVGGCKGIDDIEASSSIENVYVDGTYPEGSNDAKWLIHKFIEDETGAMTITCNNVYRPSGVGANFGGGITCSNEILTFDKSLSDWGSLLKSSLENYRISNNHLTDWDEWVEIDGQPGLSIENTPAAPANIGE